MYEISVEYSFAAGHALRGYKGKCENVHGHNYRCQVSIEGAAATHDQIRGTGNFDRDCEPLNASGCRGAPCATDSIWEGRLAATRWLVEFIGIKRDGNGKATEHKKQKGSKDVRIDNFDGGKLFDLADPNAQLLADVWKGCSQASSHATNEYNHPAVSDRKELPAALTIVLNHLQDTIYSRAGKQVRDCVLKSKD